MTPSLTAIPEGIELQSAKQFTPGDLFPVKNCEIVWQDGNEYAKLVSKNKLRKVKASSGIKLLTSFGKYEMANINLLLIYAKN